MKNYLNVKSFFSILILMLVFSCNKDDTDSNSEEENIKHLSVVTSNIGPTTYPRYARKDTLVYENERIIKSFIGSGCDPSVYQYEYGSNGKISKIYEVYFSHNGFPDVEDLINMFENSTIKENSSIDSQYELEYDSQKRLTFINNEFSSTQFLYDNEGRLYKKIISEDDLTYTVYEFDENNNPIYVTRDYGGSVTDQYYEFGSLRNPYYTLFQEFGLIYIDCALGDNFITPNVITKSGSKNITYTYFPNEDYPSSVHYQGNNSDLIYDFTYR